MTAIAIERDIAVPMRDGVCLFANLYRPADEGPHPLIMSVTPYGRREGLFAGESLDY